MQQSQRARFNPALETAVAIANRLGLPVLVGFGLTDSYPEANARHYTFMLEGLAEVEAALHERGIGFELRLGSPERIAIALARKAAVIVCDRGYLRHQKGWRDTVARAVGCRVVQVEGDAVVPVAVASEKREDGARTIRPKILRCRDDFIRPVTPLAVAVPADRLDRRARSTSPTSPGSSPRFASITPSARSRTSSAARRSRAAPRTIHRSRARRLCRRPRRAGDRSRCRSSPPISISARSRRSRSRLPSAPPQPISRTAPPISKSWSSGASSPSTLSNMSRFTISMMRCRNGRAGRSTTTATTRGRTSMAGTSLQLPHRRPLLECRHA